MVQWIRDVGTIMSLCFRLLFARKWIWTFFLGMGVVYLLLLSGLTQAAQEKGRIPMAVVWEREDLEAESLVEFLRSQPVVKIWEMPVEEDMVWEANLKEALRKRKEGGVSVVLVIEQGYKEWIRSFRSANKKKPLTFYYGQEDFRILSDLVAGGILERYCLYQSYAFYKRQEEKEPVSVSWDEYEKRAGNWQETDAREEIFTIWQETPSGQERVDETAFAGETVYLQIVLGMLAGIMMLLAVLLYAGGKKTVGLNRTGSLPWSAVRAGEFVYVLLSEVVVGIVLLFVFLWKSGTLTGGSVPLDGGRLLLRAMGWLIMFLLLISVLFAILWACCHNQERFLMAGMIVCVVLLLLALVRAVATFLPESLERIVRYSPGGWFVERMIKCCR